MVTSVISKAGLGVIGGTLATELGLGQIELMAAEVAIVGGIVAVKYLRNRRKQKQQQQPQQPSQIDQDEPEAPDANDFNQNENAEEEQKLQDRDQSQRVLDWQLNRIAEQSRQRIDNLEAENQIEQLEPVSTPDPDVFLYPPGVREEIDRYLQQQREEEQKQNRANRNPYPGPDGDPYGRGGGGNPNPNPDGNNAGVDNRRNKNPYGDILSYLTWLQGNIKRAEVKEEEKQPNEEVKESENNDDANMHLIQDEIAAQIAALGQLQLTEEQTYVELERIEKMIDQQIPDQVLISPDTIYSSDIIQY